MTYAKNLFLSLVVLLLFLPVSGQASVVVGQDCDQLGVSQMTDDHGAVAVCLLKTADGSSNCGSGKCIWRTMADTSQSCASGKVMTGTSNGKPVCKTLTCRQVYGYGTSGPSFVATATCNSDEILTGMGAQAETPGVSFCSGTNAGFIHAMVPAGNAAVVDAYRYDWSMEDCTLAIAICCKFQ